MFAPQMPANMREARRTNRAVWPARPEPEREERYEIWPRGRADEQDRAAAYRSERRPQAGAEEKLHQ